MLGEAVIAALRDDDVIEQHDAEQLSDLHQAQGEELVFAARQRLAARVVVGDHRRHQALAHQRSKHIRGTHLYAVDLSERR